MAAAEVKPHITGFDMNIMRNPVAGERKPEVKPCMLSQSRSWEWLCDSWGWGKQRKGKEYGKDI